MFWNGWNRAVPPARFRTTCPWLPFPPLIPQKNGSSGTAVRLLLSLKYLRHVEDAWCFFSGVLSVVSCIVFSGLCSLWLENLDLEHHGHRHVSKQGRNAISVHATSGWCSALLATGRLGAPGVQWWEQSGKKKEGRKLIVTAWNRLQARGKSVCVNLNYRICLMTRKIRANFVLIHRH